MQTNATSMPLLPLRVQIVWTIALAIVLASHLPHAWRMRGQPRWWHGGHVFMAAGMIMMYFPPSMMSGWFNMVKHPSLIAFSVIATVFVAITVTSWVRERSLNMLWVLASLDMMAMAYVWAPPQFRPAALTWVIIIYFSLETVVWLVGAWGRLPRTRVAAEGQAHNTGTPTSGARGIATVPDPPLLSSRSTSTG